MPRRRMISPEFWKDPDIRKLSREERLFFLGCVSHADDEGRLMGHPAYLKAMIFMYDDDLSLDGVKDLRDSMLGKVRNLVLYTNGEEEYLAFLKWAKHQKPSRPTPSDFPPPPKDLTDGISESLNAPITNRLTESPRASLGQVSQGQSSLGKYSIGKEAAVTAAEDFMGYLTSEKDLTDFLTTVLTKYIPRGPTFMMPVISKLWLQARGQEIDRQVFDVLYSALGKYPLPVMGKSIVKAVKYSEGKHKPAKYIQTILQEQMKEYEKENKVP